MFTAVTSPDFFVLELATQVGVQSTLVILCSLCAGSFLKSNAATRHFIWITTFVFIACIPLQAYLPTMSFFEEAESSPALLERSRELADVEAGMVGARPLEAPTIATFAASDALATSESHTHYPSPKQASLNELFRTSIASFSNASVRNISLSRWILAIWGFGVVIGALRMLHGVITVRRILGDSHGSEDVGITVAAELAAMQTGLSEPPRLLVSGRVAAPLTAGLLRPTVILPANASLEKEELRQIFVHEFTHVRRNDTLVGIMQRCLMVLLWPQPLIRGASANLNRAREELCDNAVLKTVSATEYAETLLKLATHSRRNGLSQLAMGLFGWQWNLETRIQQLVAIHRELDSRARLRVQIATLSCFVAFAAMGAWTHQLNAQAQPVLSPERQASLLKQTPQKVLTFANHSGAMPVEEDLAFSVPAIAEKFVHIDNLSVLNEIHEKDYVHRLMQFVESFFRSNVLRQEFDFALTEILQTPISEIAVSHWERHYVIVFRSSEPVQTELRLSPRFEIEKHDGLKVIRYDTPAQGSIYQWQTGDRIIIASSTLGLKEMTKQGFQPLATTSEFRRRFGEERPAADTEAMVRWFHKKSTNRRAASRVLWTFGDAESGVIYLSGLQDGIAKHRTTFEVTDTWREAIRTGFAFRASKSLPPESWVPTDVATYATLHLDMPASIPVVKQIIDEMVASQGFCDDVLKSFATDISGPLVDLEADLFPHLGDRLSYVDGFGGDPEKWIVSLHLHDQRAVAKTIEKLMEKEPLASVPEQLPNGGVLVAIRADSNDRPASLPGVDEDEPLITALQGWAVHDNQLFVASDVTILRSICEPAQEQPALRDHANFDVLLERQDDLASEAWGRIYRVGGSDSHVPPFVLKLAARSEDSSFRYPPLGLLQNAHSSAMALRSSDDGFVIEGVVLAAP